MIRSYKDRTTRQIASGKAPKGFPPDVFKRALNKLTILDAVTSLEDLRSPPGNMLETLSKDRVGQHSIRINDQWRICFSWTDAGPENVEIGRLPLTKLGQRPQPFRTSHGYDHSPADPSR